MQGSSINKFDIRNHLAFQRISSNILEPFLGNTVPLAKHLIMREIITEGDILKFLWPGHVYANGQVILNNLTMNNPPCPELQGLGLEVVDSLRHLHNGYLKKGAGRLCRTDRSVQHHGGNKFQLFLVQASQTQSLSIFGVQVQVATRFSLEARVRDTNDPYETIQITKKQSEGQEFIHIRKTLTQPTFIAYFSR